MKNIVDFNSFNEGKNWIKDAIKKPGALKKSLGKNKDEKISKTEIESELSKLKAKDKDKKKPGTQLGKKDATKKRRLELAKTLKSLKENINNDVTIDITLDVEEADFLYDLLREQHETYSGNTMGSTNNRNIANDILEKLEEKMSDSDYNSDEYDEEEPLLGGPESSHTIHDNYMRDINK